MRSRNWHVSIMTRVHLALWAVILACFARAYAQNSTDCGINQASFIQCQFNAVLTPENLLARDVDGACNSTRGNPEKQACCYCDNWKRIYDCYGRFCTHSSGAEVARQSMQMHCKQCTNNKLSKPVTSFQNGPASDKRISGVMDDTPEPGRDHKRKGSKKDMGLAHRGSDDDNKDKDKKHESKDGSFAFAGASFSPISALVAGSLVLYFAGTLQL